MTGTRGACLLAPLLLSVVLASGGCSGTGGGSGDGGSDNDSSANEVSVLGIAFEVPDGWEELELEDGDLPEEAAGLAEGLGLTPEQFDQAVRSVDLFVVDGDGPENGFLSNVNVLDQAGAMPSDDQIEQQFQTIAEEVEVTHEDTSVGDVVAVQYSLKVQDHGVEGVAYLFSQDDEVINITVSTPDREESQEIGDGIIATLAEAS